jgi:hypothetical protein
LKKQTAIRLANENQLHSDESSYSSAQRGPHAVYGGRVVAPSPTYSAPSNELNNFTPSVAYHTNLKQNVHRGYQQQQQQPKARPKSQQAAARTYSNSSFDSSSHKKGSKQVLTVNELKEMTKARLHAQKLHVESHVSEYRDPRDYQMSPLPRLRTHSAFSQGTWETNSVSSVASEFLGSASFDDHTSPYTPCDPVNNFSTLPPPDSVQPGSIQPSHIYDGQHVYTPNRRRAATLSPRLSYLDEHRQLLMRQDPLPSFATPTRTFQTRFQAFCSPSFENQLVTDDFSLMQGLSAMETLDDDSRFVAGLADDFTSQLNGGTLSATMSDSLGLGGASRVRASTWAPSTDSLFGMRDDLASILKLSGAEEERDSQMYRPPGL